MIYDYFFKKQFRIKEYNSAYDDSFGMNQNNPIDIFTKQGCIFVTNKISKFEADIFMFRRIFSDIKYNSEKVK